MNCSCSHGCKGPAASTLGPDDRNSLCICQLFQDAECETFNQVFQWKATSGNRYPDVINHFGHWLPDCCPGDEYRTPPSECLEGPSTGKCVTTVLRCSPEGTTGTWVTHL